MLNIIQSAHTSYTQLHIHLQYTGHSNKPQDFILIVTLHKSQQYGLPPLPHSILTYSKEIL